MEGPGTAAVPLASGAAVASAAAATAQWGGSSGSVRSTAEFRRNPRLWIFPPALSSAQAHLSLRLSAVWPYSEVRHIDTYGECFDSAFCRLNPDMTVPVLEVEDKVVTGAGLIADFLQERYAGDGDGRAALAGRGPTLERLKALAEGWDEELYAHSGSRHPPGHRLVDRLRLVRLKQRCLEALEDDEASSSEDGDGDEEGTEADEYSAVGGSPPGVAATRASQELQEAYARKIASLQFLGEVAGSASEEEWRQALQRNRRVLSSVWRAASDLLQAGGGTGGAASSTEGFLLGRELTTADAFFVPILCRMQASRPRDFAQHLKKHPAVQRYWSRVQKQEETQVVIGLHAWGSLADPLLLKKMLPCQLLGVRCGCVVAPDLPEEVEERVRKIQAELRMRHCGS